jgi:hypothetical protein
MQTRGEVERTPAGAVVGLSLGAALVVLIACTEPTAIERPARSGATMFLNATAAAAVRTVLADVSFRIGDAIEDGAARTHFEGALARLTDNIASGQLDSADAAISDARAALLLATAADFDGSGDADRTAIALAIGVATEEITNARLAAGGL